MKRYIIDQIFSAIATNIVVFIPLVALFGSIAYDMFSPDKDYEKLQEENEYLKHLLAQKTNN